MHFGTRTLAALAQLLASMRPDAVRVLLEKCGADHWHVDGQEVLLAALRASSPESLLELMTEVCVRRRSARADAPTKHVFDDRFEELQRCLRIDGWEVGPDALLREQPSSSDLIALRDALENHLAESAIDGDGEIRRCLASSAKAFADAPPDYNASTTHIRIALETCVRRCASAIAARLSVAPPEDRWGPAIAFLRQNDVLSPSDEAAVTASYTATSPGAHVPKGLSDTEWARMVRAIDQAWLFFVLKRAAV